LIFKRHVALPGDHGSWVFLLSPLLIGLAAGGTWKTVTSYLVVACMAAFLSRQPLTVAVKVWSGRRSRQDLPAALFWTVAYGAVGTLHLVGLVLRGFGYLLYLAIPGVLVFCWYLWLVSRRAERRQFLMEVLATGVLALSAPAAMWVGVGWADPRGWLLWGLTWAQTVASLLYAFMRLSQRTMDNPPDVAKSLRIAGATLVMTSLSLGIVVGLSLGGIVPRWLFVAYIVQWAETIWGTLRPAVGQRPRAIGLRQLAVSALYTLLFSLTWVL